jgi:hypothetical protein
MPFHRVNSSLATLATLVALGLIAGCGSDDKAGSKTASTAPAPSAIDAAKATLSKDCQQGKASDKPLCDCIADKLEEAGNDADHILAINKLVNGGTTPTAVAKAAKACANFAAG